MLNTTQKKWIYRTLIMLIFIFAFSVRVHHLSEKKGFHTDEILSIVITDYENVGWKTNPPEGEYTGKELKNMILKVDPSFRGAMSDIALLWDSTRDSPHTNFYYSIFRLSLIGLESTDYEDFKEQYIFRMCLLNLGLFSLSFFAFLLFLNSLIKDKILILLGLAIPFISIMDISNALFFRNYLLQSFFVITFTAFLLYVYKKVKSENYVDSWQNMFIFALPLSLMLLTGYFTFIYAFFIGIFFVIFPLRETKQLNLVPFFFFASILSVLYCLFFYNDFMAGFYSYRTTQSLTTNGISIERILPALRCIYGLIRSMFYIPILLLFSIAIIYKLKNKDSFSVLKEYKWIILGAIFSSIFVLYISPVKVLRYFSSFIIISTLIFPLALSSIKKTKFKNIISTLMIISMILVVFIKDNKIANKYNNIKSFPSSVEEDLSGIENTPIYVNIKGWLYSETLQYLDDDQKFIVCDTIESLLIQVEEKNALVLINKKEELDLTEYGFELLNTSPGHNVNAFKRIDK